MTSIKFMMMATCREGFNYSYNLLLIYLFILIFYFKKTKANKSQDLIEVGRGQTSVHCVIFSPIVQSLQNFVIHFEWFEAGFYFQ